MITKPILLDETGVKIKQAIIRVKNKFLGEDDSAITPGTAGTSGVEPVIQDDTGRDIISALNDLGDAVKPASTTDSGLVTTGAQTFAGEKTFTGSIYTNGNVSAQGSGQFGNSTESATVIALTNSTGTTNLHRSGNVGGIYDSVLQDWLIHTDGVSAAINPKLYLPSGYQMGNWLHSNAGNQQYQEVSNSSFSATNAWQTVPNLSLSAPIVGLYAIEAMATYNNAQPSALAIITRSASSSYNDYRAIVDRGASGLTDGTTQYLNCSCVARLSAGDVVIVRARYAYSGADNYIRLRMWLL